MFEDQAEQNGNTLRMADELAPQDLYLRLNVLKKSKSVRRTMVKSRQQPFQVKLSKNW